MNQPPDSPQSGGFPDDLMKPGSISKKRAYVCDGNNSDTSTDEHVADHMPEQPSETVPAKKARKLPRLKLNIPTAGPAEVGQLHAPASLLTSPTPSRYRRDTECFEHMHNPFSLPPSASTLARPFVSGDELSNSGAPDRVPMPMPADFPLEAPVWQPTIPINPQFSPVYRPASHTDGPTSPVRGYWGYSPSAFNSFASTYHHPPYGSGLLPSAYSLPYQYGHPYDNHRYDQNAGRRTLVAYPHRSHRNTYPPPDCSPLRGLGANLPALSELSRDSPSFQPGSPGANWPVPFRTRSLRDPPIFMPDSPIFDFEPDGSVSLVPATIASPRYQPSSSSTIPALASPCATSAPHSPAALLPPARGTTQHRDLATQTHSSPSLIPSPTRPAPSPMPNLLSTAYTLTRLSHDLYTEVDHMGEWHVAPEGLSAATQLKWLAAHEERLDVLEMMLKVKGYRAELGEKRAVLEEVAGKEEE